MLFTLCSPLIIAHDGYVQSGSVIIVKLIGNLDAISFPQKLNVSPDMASTRDDFPLDCEPTTNNRGTFKGTLLL